MSEKGYVLDADLFSLTPEVQDRIPDKEEAVEESDQADEEEEKEK